MADAVVVAAQAGADILHAAFLNLVEKLGIRDQLPSDHHVIDLSLLHRFQSGVRSVRAGTHDRFVRHLADGSGSRNAASP